MVAIATLMKEIEKLPEEFVVEVFNFVLFLRTRIPEYRRSGYFPR
jgi:hypothetical protein